MCARHGRRAWQPCSHMYCSFRKQTAVPVWEIAAWIPGVISMLTRKAVAGSISRCCNFPSTAQLQNEPEISSRRAWSADVCLVSMAYHFPITLYLAMFQDETCMAVPGIGVALLWTSEHHTLAPAVFRLFLRHPGPTALQLATCIPQCASCIADRKVSLQS